MEVGMGKRQNIDRPWKRNTWAVALCVQRIWPDLKVPKLLRRPAYCPRPVRWRQIAKARGMANG